MQTEPGPASRRLYDLYTGLIPLLGVLWILDIPQRLNLPLVDEELLPWILGIATAAALLKYPYRGTAVWLNGLLGVVAIATWGWSAINYEAWMVSFAERRPDQWVPGIIALLLMLEAIRKACGIAITVLVWTFIGYALIAHFLPGLLVSPRHSPPALVMYLYADSQGVPGFVLRVIATLVLAFIILGRLMESSGATHFFTELAMRLMGHRRGGPAKVAVVASSAFGMVSGSTVGNIMSTGMVTIPLMKKSGFPPRYAAAIEAVASNGGQIAPPLMGAAAFLIAEFLQIEYRTIVIAAILPAILYFLVLFVQVDAAAVRLGMKSSKPAGGVPIHRLLLSNWIFIAPIAVLLFLLFAWGWDPALCALTATAVLFAVMTVRQRSLPRKEQWHALLSGSGHNMVPIILIGGGAGIVIGVLNGTGLGFQLSLGLAAIGAEAGLFFMLLLSAMIAIILGMGMPTAAVYLVLSVVLGPALVEFGVPVLAAHLFIFYFGVLSMLTPPVAIASFVAASIADSDFWSTSLCALKLGIAAYLIPFLWIYNPALIMQGSLTEIMLVMISAGTGAFLLARALSSVDTQPAMGALGVLCGLAVGSSTVWLGSTSWWTLPVTAVGVCVAVFQLRPRLLPPSAAV